MLVSMSHTLRTISAVMVSSLLAICQSMRSFSPAAAQYATVFFCTFSLYKKIRMSFFFRLSIKDSE